MPPNTSGDHRASRHLCALACAALMTTITVVGCVRVPTSPFAIVDGPAIGGLTIRNDSAERAENVRIEIAGTRQHVTCGYILARTACATTFPVTRYEGRFVALSWTQRGLSMRSKPFIVPLPDPVPVGRPLEVVVHFGSQTGISSYMRLFRF